MGFLFYCSVSTLEMNINDQFELQNGVKMYKMECVNSLSDPRIQNGKPKKKNDQFQMKNHIR